MLATKLLKLTKIKTEHTLKQFKILIQYIINDTKITLQMHLGHFTEKKLHIQGYSNLTDYHKS